MTPEEEAIIMENSPFQGDVRVEYDERPRKRVEKTFTIGGIKVKKSNRDYLVSIPTSLGTAEFVYTELSRTPQSFNTVISVHFNDYKDGVQPSFTQRINLQSASAITDLRRSLDDAYGKQHKWSLLLNKANNAIREAFMEDQKPVNVADMTYAHDTLLLRPFLQKDVSNMVFGDSEVGKTYFCMRLAASLATGVPFMGFDSPKGIKTLLLDYEDSLATFNNRMLEIAAGMGLQKSELAPYMEWFKPDGSIRDIAEIIARVVADREYGLIVIDAGSNAAGGSPNDEQKVVDMFNALESIPCTKLIIHHEPKTVDGVADNKAYYGSAFWRALSRVAWRLVLVNEEDGKHVKATITKKSNLGKVAPFHYRQKWMLGGIETGYEACYFDIIDEFEESDEVKILAYLYEGEAELPSIINAVGLPRSTVQRRLDEMILSEKIGRKRSGKKYVYYVPKRD